MIDRADLLIEIGTEELPPKSLARLSAAFTQGLATGLDSAGLTPTGQHSFATPRRLGALFENVPLAQADRAVERRGPALAAAFDAQGQATKAAQGFARSCGVDVDSLSRMETDKGAWLVYRATEAGRSSAECLPEIIEQALARLPVPKRMRWGDSDVEFVRPVHWLVILLGQAVIPARILGIESGRATRGHRFHAPQPIELAAAADYEHSLREQGHVEPVFARRRERIAEQVRSLGQELGGRALVDEDLLDEVTALVEWPVAIGGSFEDKYLEVPAEALISTMQDNQKYFPVVDADGGLLPRFITISNIDSRDPDKVREGNERVIRPRLADAAFFWHQDRSRTLHSLIPRLQSVVFQKQLGSIHDKALRVGRLSQIIATEIDGDTEHATRAAELAKCDLMTEMVYEFPELQGIMGRYYAKLEGEADEVAEALDEQYLPRFAGDRLPATASGRALAIADRLDTLIGIFAIGQKPSGVKDPYALRRAALGVLRIMIECRLDLDLRALLQRAADGLADKVDAAPVVEEVFDFMLDRMRAYYSESGHAPQVFDAVLARRPTRPLDFDTRMHAVTSFNGLAEADSLAAANKRIGNILRKTQESVPDALDPSLLQLPQERALAAAIDALDADVATDFAKGDYTAALNRLAGLREPVDAFFDHVMVMAEEDDLRRNRLALLKRMDRLFSHVADLSLLRAT